MTISTARHAVVTLLALASVALAGAGGVRGATSASPEPTIGGALSNNGTALLVRSNGNVPAHVLMTAETVILDVDTFDLGPGEERVVGYVGEPTGHVTATFSVQVPGLGDASGVTLSLNLRPMTPAFDWTLAWMLLLVAALVVLTGVLRPWEWRVTRVGRAS